MLKIVNVKSKFRMNKYFNVGLEFNHLLIKNLIEDSISNQKKGYVCLVDANVLTIAQKDEEYCSVLNNAIVNSCDGSSIAWLAGLAHGKKYRAWNGPEIFSFYIEKEYKHLLLGNKFETGDEIKQVLIKKGFEVSNISVLPLPFNAVDDFDYIGIAKEISYINPDFIWVSLGAPKQELFMFKLLPYLSRGLMFGIGAAFNFYIGKISLPNSNFGALKFIWIIRLFNEPKKQFLRILPFIFIIPKLYFLERCNSIKHLN